MARKLQQLRYTTQIGFRWDLLLIPMFLAYGFAGMAFSVLDILLLKADNIIGLFQVTGISEWATYLGVFMYKFSTTFAPFFLLLVILGLALKSVLFGNAGRWLASILVMFLYAFSNTPMGLLIAKRFVKSNYRAVANWFPGFYMTVVALPYLALNIAYQSVPQAQDTLQIISDVLCILPPFAFQRGLGSIIGNLSGILRPGSHVGRGVELGEPCLVYSAHDVCSWQHRVDLLVHPDNFPPRKDKVV